MSFLQVLPEELWRHVNYIYIKNIGYDEWQRKIAFVHLSIIADTCAIYEFLQNHVCGDNKICAHIYKKKINIALCRILNYSQRRYGR